MNTVIGEVKETLETYETEHFVFPATPGQKRFWLLDQLNPGSPALNMPVALRVDGNLDDRILESTLNEIVQRHEALRTTFEADGHGVNQVISSRRRIGLPITDVSALQELEKEQRTAQFVLESAQVVLNLARGPLVDCRLIRLAATQHVLTITMHHTVCDGWSNGIIVREIAEIYEALRRGKSNPLPDLEIQYADFAEWQSQWVHGQAAQEALAYWRNELREPAQRLDFPTDRSRQRDKPSAAGAFETLLLRPDLTRALREFCLREEVTLYVVLFTVYLVFLHRYTGQEIFQVGSPAAGRTRPELEGIIGLFANPQILRADFTSHPTGRELMARVRQWTLDVSAFQDLPFETIMEDLAERGAGDRLELQTYFVFQRAFMQPQKMAGLEMIPLRSVSPGAIFDLFLAVVERAEGPRLQMEYNPDLFDRETIQKLLGLYGRLLTAFLQHPSQPVADFKVLTPSEERSFLLGQSAPRIRRTEQIELEYVAPRTKVESKLAGIWEETIGKRPIGVTANFFDAGGKSLMVMRLVSEINRAFAANLPVTAVFRAPTIERMAKLIDNRVDQTSSLVPLQTEGSRRPFFMVHSYMLYGRMPHALGLDQPFYGLQQPPLDGSLNPRWVDDMIADHVRHIRAVQPHGPYQIGGWCFAGLMAFEVARHLELAGEKVSLLALFDSWCPFAGAGGVQAPRETGSRDAMRTLNYYFKFYYTKLTTGSWSERGDQLYRLIRNQFRRVEIAVRAKARDAAFHLCLRRGWPIPSFLRDVTVVTGEWLKEYQPTQYSGDITLFRAEDLAITPGEDPTCGWGKLTNKRVRSVFSPGNRRSMFLEPHLPVLARKILTEMDRAAGEY